MIFYKISVSLYFLAIRIASLFKLNKKAMLMVSGRKNWKENLESKIEKDKKYIWVHCASLGEFEQGRPLIEKFKSEKPQYKIILTFFSPSGFEIRKNYEHADIICYLPFDTKKNSEDFINIVKPDFAVFVKYEFWYYFINKLNKSNTPFFLISGIFRVSQIFFKPYGKFYLKAVKGFSHLFLQDENSQIILEEFGVKNTSVCGDTRIDRVIHIAGEKYENPFFERFSSGANVIACGSTWSEDEKILTEFINNSDSSYKFIIAPHEVTSKHVNDIEAGIKRSCKRYSKVHNSEYVECDVVIIDSIGVLSKLYRYGKIAYIGGGFGKGIHNILEAAVYNIPVIFGPNYKKFKEAVDLINLGTAFSINNADRFNFTVNDIINDTERFKRISNNTKIYFDNFHGSTQYIFDKISNICRKQE